MRMSEAMVNEIAGNAVERGCDALPLPSIGMGTAGEETAIDTAARCGVANLAVVIAAIGLRLVALWQGRVRRLC